MIGYCLKHKVKHELNKTCAPMMIMSPPPLSRSALDIEEVFTDTDYQPLPGYDDMEEETLDDYQPLPRDNSNTAGVQVSMEDKHHYPFLILTAFAAGLMLGLLIGVNT